MLENKQENLHDTMIEKWLQAFVIPLFKSTVFISIILH